jgi:hypothetical protein
MLTSRRVSQNLSTPNATHPFGHLDVAQTFGGELTWRSLIRSISCSHESSCVNAQLYREGKWFVVFSPEFPEANGQGETRKHASKA